MKREKRIHKILVMLLLFSMMLSVISGCGKQALLGGEGNGEGTAAESTGKGNTAAEQSSEGTAMGRYVENVTDLADFLGGYGNKGIYRLSDNSLVISDTFSAFFNSKDNGETWEEDSRKWRTKMLENGTYIMSMAVGGDNTVGIIYHDDTDVQEETAQNEEWELNPKLLIIKPDGTEIPVDIAATEEDSYLYQVYVSDTGRIFVSTMGSGNIYEAKEDGSSEVFLTLEEGRPELIQIQDNLMVIDAYSKVLIYDLEKEEYIEDEVLDEFINTNYKDRNNIGGNWYNLYFFFGEEGILYLAGKKGLHRHVIGGSAIEQVIDGSLCTFNNPAYGILGMVALDNNEFMTLFTGDRLVRFTYNPDIPTIPNEKLKVYSLRENDTMRQAITLYQTANPEVFVEYEIGMGEENSVTREDALKSLNTKIMAGDGPDVLVLDGMPVDSYVEKGLLLDLTSVLSDLSGEAALFENIVEAVKSDDKVYAMPCEIQLPIILGDKKYTSQINDLKGIADAVEELRKDNPEKDLLGICTEKGIMRLFSMVSVPAWTTAAGEIDKEAITEFLTQTKRIYDAQMEGISEKTVEEYNDMNEHYLQEIGVSRDDSDYLRKSVSAINYVGGLSYLNCGALCDAYGYANIFSVNRADGIENSEWILMNGQSSNVFCAQTLMGISAASKNTEQAQEFIKVCFGKDNQSYLFNGFAVNKAAFEESFVPDEDILGEDGSYGMMCLGNDEGLFVSMDIYWPNEEQIALFRKYIESVDTAYIKDDILEEAVYEEGIAYMQGTQGLEEAVADIEKKISIYMAE